MSVVDEFQNATEGLAAATVAAVRAIYLRLVAGEITRDDAVLLIAAEINQSGAAAVTLADAYLVMQIEELSGIPAAATGVLPVDSSERLVKAATTILSDENRVVERAVPSHHTTPGPKVAQRGAQGQSGTDTMIVPVEGAVTQRVATPVVVENTTTDPGGGADNLDDEPDDDIDMRLERLARGETFEAAQQATHDAIQQQPLVEGWSRKFDADPCQLCVWWARLDDDGQPRIWPKAHPFQRHTGCNCQPQIVLAERIQSTQFTRGLTNAR